MSFIIPKKQILYAPMLGSLGGGSVRGFGRGVGGGPNIGGVLFQTTGSHTFTVPENIFFVHVVAVGGGGGGSIDHDGSGGAGAGLGWRNNIAVTPGQNITLVVGSGGDKESTQGGNLSQVSYNGANGTTSYFSSTSVVSGEGGQGGKYGGGGASSYGGFTGQGGGYGGYSGIDGTGQLLNPTGGGGAGGYVNVGGLSGGRGMGKNELPDTTGSYPTYGQGGGGGGGGGIDNYSAFAGGGVGVYGQGSSGASGRGQASGYSTANLTNSVLQNILTGRPGSGGALPELITLGGFLRARGGNYGGGGAAGYNSTLNYSTKGGDGAVRIIWGESREFPSTNVDLASSTSGETTV